MLPTPSALLVAHLLFVNEVLLQVPKLLEILDTAQPFVPMRQSGVGLALGFGPSQSPRWWLLLHWASSLVLVVGLLRWLVLGRDTDTGNKRSLPWAALLAFTVLILGNCWRFGSLPTGVALAVNIGCAAGICVALLLASSTWAAALGVGLLGLPSFLEAVMIVVYRLPWASACLVLLVLCCALRQRAYRAYERELHSLTSSVVSVALLTCARLALRLAMGV